MISQLKSGMLSNYKESIDITEIILKAFNQLEPFFIAKELKLAISFSCEINNFLVDIDKDKLWIVLLNIVENEGKYSQQRLIISCDVFESVDGAYLSVSITNTITHSTVDVHNLKDAFYLSDPAQQGSGVGLWLSNQLISMQGGSFY